MCSRCCAGRCDRRLRSERGIVERPSVQPTAVLAMFSGSTWLPAVTGLDDEGQARQRGERQDEPRVARAQQVLHSQHAQRIPAPVVNAIAPSDMRASDSLIRVVFTSILSPKVGVPRLSSAAGRPPCGRRSSGFASPPRDGFALDDLCVVETIVVSWGERWSWDLLTEMTPRYQDLRPFGSVHRRTGWVGLPGISPPGSGPGWSARCLRPTRGRRLPVPGHAWRTAWRSR